MVSQSKTFTKRTKRKQLKLILFLDYSKISYANDVTRDSALLRNGQFKKTKLHIATEEGQRQLNHLIMSP